MLYAPANITVEETKLVRAELFMFLHNWIKNHKKCTLLNLESQFIGLEEHELPTEGQTPALYNVLRRMQIDQLWFFMAFIVVSENKEFPIHIDNYDQSWSTVGLNIPVLNCHDSKTVWYDSIPSDDTAMPDYISSLTYHGTMATKCVSTNVNEIGSCDANIPHWVNVSVPHAPVCNHSKLRINSSIRFEFTADDFFNDPKFEHCMIKNLSK